MRTVLLGLMAAAVAAHEAPAGFALGMSPVRWEVEGKPGKTVRAAVTLTSGARTIQEVKATAGDWDLTDEGSPVYHPAGSQPESAASWVQIRPDSVKVYPRQKKTVRVSVDIPEDTPDGSYRAAVFFEAPGEESADTETGASVFLRGRVAFLVYITVGNARPQGEILGAAWREVQGKHQVAVQVCNNGNAHLRLNGFFDGRLPEGGRLEGQLPGIPLLPGQSRWVPLEFADTVPPPGTPLSLTLRADLGDGEGKHEVTVAADGSE